MSVVDDAALAGMEGEAGAAPKRSKKKLLIIIAAALLVLGAGGGFGAYMFLGGEAPADGAPAEVVDTTPPVFYDMPAVPLMSSGFSSIR
jgi:flagellar FliL protein